MKTNIITRIYLTIAIGIVSILSAMGQGNAVKYDLFNMAENSKLEVFNRKVSTFTENDKKGIRFSKNENDGVAWLNGV